MSEQDSNRPHSIKSALTPGQPALPPHKLQRLIRLLSIISILVSVIIVAQQYKRRNSLKQQLTQAEIELNTLEKREEELSKIHGDGKIERVKHSDEEHTEEKP